MWQTIPTLVVAHLTMNALSKQFHFMDPLKILNIIFNVINILFFGNTASEQGANIFGGLLDRCIPSPFAEVYGRLEAPPPHYSGISYLGDITNTTALLDTISSPPVRVCFCRSESEPDCSYQPPITKVKKGEAFTVPLVAVDQVNHSVDANIISSLSSQRGGFSEGQQTQSVGKKCNNVTFNVFSRYNFEIINLFADGPCGSSTLSTRHLYIYSSVSALAPLAFSLLIVTQDVDVIATQNCLLISLAATWQLNLL